MLLSAAVRISMRNPILPLVGLNTRRSSPQLDLAVLTIVTAPMINRINPRLPCLPRNQSQPIPSSEPSHWFRMRHALWTVGAGGNISQASHGRRIISESEPLDPQWWAGAARRLRPNDVFLPARFVAQCAIRTGI